MSKAHIFKQVLNRGIHILVAFVVLFASSGVVLTKHFCQKQLSGYALYITPQDCHDKATGCSADAVSKSCCAAISSGISGCELPGNEGEPCCTNEQYFLKLEEDFQSFVFQQLDDVSLIMAAPIQVLEFAHPNDLFKVYFKNYHPPPIVQDMVVLQQSFLC